MRIEIFGKNYNPSDSLKAITEKKCAKLERRFEDENAEVKFTVTYENGDYTTDMVVTSKGISYRASAMSDSPFDNLDEVIPRLLGQMRKQKAFLSLPQMSFSFPMAWCAGQRSTSFLTGRISF